MKHSESSGLATNETPVDTGGQSGAEGASEALLARATQLDLGGDFELPPGDPVTHFGAGFAKTMASNVFLTGLAPEFAAEHTGYFTAPYEDRVHVVGYEGDIVYDTSKPDGTPRTLLDTSRLSGLGWEPRIGLREGIGSTLAWYREHVLA